MDVDCRLHVTDTQRLEKATTRVAEGCFTVRILIMVATTTTSRRERGKRRREARLRLHRVVVGLISRLAWYSLDSFIHLKISSHGFISWCGVMAINQEC